METFSALLALRAGNSPVPSEFPSQRPVTRSFDVFFHLSLNKRLSKQSWGWWFEMPSRSLWRHCNSSLRLWGHDRKFHLRKDKVLLALDVIKSIWGEQSSSSDMVMPKYLASLTWSSGCPSRVYMRLIGVWDLLIPSMLHFLTLKCMPHIEAQLSREHRCCWRAIESCWFLIGL